MGCSSCFGLSTPSRKIKPQRAVTPPFLSAHVYLLSENSVALSEFDTASLLVSAAALPLTTYFTTYIKRFPRFFRMANMKNTLYLCGGKDSKQEFWAKTYQIVTLAQAYTISERADMSESKCNMGIGVIDEESFVVVGGSNSDILKTVEIYNIHNNTWSGLNSLNIGRYGCAVCVFNQYELYAIGGCSFDLETATVEIPNRTIEHYDLTRPGAPWTLVPIYSSLWPGSVESACIQRSPNEILICGGYSRIRENYSAESSEVESEAPTSDVYMFNVYYGKIGRTQNGMSGRDVFTSGFSYSGNATLHNFGLSGTVYCYNTEQDSWTVVGAVTQAVQWEEDVNNARNGNALGGGRSTKSLATATQS